jgi:tRNA-specific 2-thiouridylase
MERCIMLETLMSTERTSKNISLKAQKGRKVFVGLSGGVDSAVSAALLKEAGYDVTGVFIKTWSPDFIPCTWREERRDAMRVAAHLDIPFLFFDLEEEYKKGVADLMIEEYKQGRTPNPDVLCNKVVKFGAFWQKAQALGADFIAMGHYLSGENDQRYFLWMLTPEDWKHTLFPVGHMEKPEVRKLAKRFRLPVAEKKDSQGICFLGDIDMKDFLSHYIETRPGDALDLSGQIIGRHDGALYYTIGERHGLEIQKKLPDTRPYFVVAKDMERNTVTVSSDKNEISEALPLKIRIRETNWTKTPEKKDLLAQIRYKQTRIPVRLESDTATFDTPQTASPGQSIVFYDGDEMLGGAIIS